MNVTEQISEFIKEHFEIGEDPDFTNDVHLFNEGFVDSFGAVEIVHFLEETFDIKITQRDITLFPMNTVSELAAVVESKL